MREFVRRGPSTPVLAGIVALASTLPFSADEAEKLPPGFVRGDVVSRSWVPIRTWTPREGNGVLPYLMEYYLMQWHGDRPLEDFHAENLRRIDIASRWSTAIMLYARHDAWHDELIRLMLRCLRNRQLIGSTGAANTWPSRRGSSETSSTASSGI
jgi:hypothetical protein